MCSRFLFYFFFTVFVLLFLFYCFYFTVFVLLFFFYCFCLTVFVLLLLFYCFCFTVFVLLFLFYCFCFTVFVLLLLFYCFCFTVFVSLFLFYCFCTKMHLNQHSLRLIMFENLDIKLRETMNPHFPTLHFTSFTCVSEIHKANLRKSHTLYVCMNKYRWLLKEALSKRHEGYTINK